MWNLFQTCDTLMPVQRIFGVL